MLLLFLPAVQTAFAVTFLHGVDAIALQLAYAVQVTRVRKRLGF
jgi:hypothetical protein